MQASAAPARGMFHAQVPLHKKETIHGLDELVADGTIRAWSRKNDRIDIYAASQEGVAKAQSLPHDKPGLTQGLWGAAKAFFVPPNLKENCAKEYWPTRIYSMAANVFAGAIGYQSTAVLLDATRIAFSTSEKVASATFLFGILGRAAAMGASFLGKRGDIDPKKSNLIASLIASGSAIATVGVLALLPHAYIPLLAATTVVGALGGALGSSSGANIYNHMVKGNAKGEVSAKDGNQDLIVSLLGAPLAMGISHAARLAGFNPYVAVTMSCGPALMLCTVKGLQALRMHRLSAGAMDGIADQVMDTGHPAEAPHKGTLKLIASVFHDPLPKADGKVRVVDQLEDVAPPEQQAALCSVLGPDYLVNVVDGQVRLGVRQGADLGSVLQGWLHARVIDRALQSPLWPELQHRFGDAAPLALIDITGRAMPDPANLTSDIDDHGWNANAAGLNVPRLNATWLSTDPADRPMLPLSELMSLMQHPEADKLDYLFGNSGTGSPSISARAKT
ncbi:MAG TPA: RUS1 family protein [Candidatus Xenobia bacterium]